VKRISAKWAILVALLAACIPLSGQQTSANPSTTAPAAPAATDPSSSVPTKPAEKTVATSSSTAAAPKVETPAASVPASAPPGIDPKTGKPLYLTIKENWASLSVKGSELEPEPPLVGEIDEEANFTRTLVSLKWRPGDPLDVYVVVPKGVTKPPAVLYLYGYQEDTDRFKDNRWCERVTSGGVAAVGFVSAMTGHRFHDRPMKQWFVSELQESLGSTVHDIHFILDYLNTRGDIDMNRIGMFGQGSGGTIAILAAAADPRIKTIDLLEPWGDWPVWLAKSSVVQEDPEKNRYTKADFLKKVAPLDPVKWLPTLTSTKIRMQQVADNDSNPPEVQRRLRLVAPKRATVDRFDSTAQMTTVEGGGRLFNWIKDQVAKAPPEKPRRISLAKTSTAKTNTQR